MNFLIKESYNFDDLVDIMKILRAPDGCMWDREQTHKSIRQNVIEEAYETAEGIDKEDADILREELGDLLLQVVFHSQIAQDNNEFSIDDVCTGICKKLIVRHPHIFGNVKVENSDEILDNWEKIKIIEKGQKSASETVNAVPSNFPALMRSQKVQKRAAKSGFDYPNIDMAFDDLESEISELKAAISSKDDENAFEELGDVLFSVVNVSRFLKIDSELSLVRSCEKFIRRFEQVEKIAKDKQIDMTKSSIEELNNLWCMAKNAGV